MTRKEAIFWLGCFWGVQSYFDSLEGIIETEVWYAGGSSIDPTYREIWDHSEVIRIVYDEDIITYEDLLEAFIEKRDPTLPYYKDQYASIIMYETDEERWAAEYILEREAPKHNRDITVRVEEKSKFYSAEQYHQKYFEKQELSGTFFIK